MKTSRIRRLAQRLPTAGKPWAWKVPMMLAILLLASLATAETPATVGGEAGGVEGVRFEHVDVWVDGGGVEMAAYQVEVAVEKGQAVLVGIEGGAHAAFQKPPYYDPAALMSQRVILAAFTTDTSVPAGKTRVARLMLQVRGETKPEYAVKLIVAADRVGRRIAAKAGLE